MQAVMSGKDPARVGIPISEHRRSVEAVNRLFDSAVQDGANLLDSAPLLSDARGLCHAEFDGRALYSDTNHLTVAGAMRLRPLFEPVIGAIVSERTGFALFRKHGTRINADSTDRR